MKKSIGVKPYVFPMPVLMIATYNDDGSVDVMNMAWGGVCAENMVALNLDETHRTSDNIKKRGAFTLSVADTDHLAQADYFGIATANKVADKFEKSGLHAERSDKVDAPVVTEFPLTMECKVADIMHDKGGFRILGEIVNVLADDKLFGPDGKIVPERLHAFVFDQIGNGYYAVGEKVGQAWKSGADILKRK